MALEEKHRDLKATQQRKIIEQIMSELAQSHPDFYYLPAIELAAEIQSHIRESGKVRQADRELVAALSRRDIQLILGLHSTAD